MRDGERLREKKREASCTLKSLKSRLFVGAGCRLGPIIEKGIGRLWAFYQYYA